MKTSWGRVVRGVVGRVEFETIDGRILGGLGSVAAVWVGINAKKPQNGHLALYSHTYRG